MTAEETVVVGRQQPGMSSREDLKKSEYADIAEAVAGRLGMDYYGTLFSYPEVDADRLAFDKRQEAVTRGRLDWTAQRMAELKDISAPGRRGGGEGGGEEEKGEKIPPAVQLLQQEMMDLEQVILDNTACSRASGAATCQLRAGAPAAGTRRSFYSVPLDAAHRAQPSSLLKTNVNFSAAEVSLRAGMSLPWKELWYGADDTVKAMFAELVALSISEVGTRFGRGRMHDRLKVSTANSRKQELLHTFATVSRGGDGLLHFGGMGGVGGASSVSYDTFEFTAY